MLVRLVVIDPEGRTYEATRDVKIDHTMLKYDTINLPRKPTMSWLPEEMRVEIPENTYDVYRIVNRTWVGDLELVAVVMYDGYPESTYATQAITGMAYKFSAGSLYYALHELIDVFQRHVYDKELRVDPTSLLITTRIDPAFDVIKYRLSSRTLHDHGPHKLKP